MFKQGHDSRVGVEGHSPGSSLPDCTPIGREGGGRVGEGRDRGRERGREGGWERGREGRREGGREGGMEGGRVGERD